jgi:epoxyqueuosine reductase
VITAEQVRELAFACGFELAGVAAADPHPDYARYAAWVAAGRAGAMSYLEERRGEMRADPRALLPSARSIVCVGKLYNRPGPYSNACQNGGRGWIARYAWGADYHKVLREGLEELAARLRALEPCETRICVDTAPLLERSYARSAGLGWIGKNTCLINEPLGSWFFLGALLTSLELRPDAPPPDRCGTCTRCIDACPTEALVPGGGGWLLDARRCIAYLTIELKGPIPGDLRELSGNHVFGCDICQEVCPWNRRAPVTDAFDSRNCAPRLTDLAALDTAAFRERFGGTPVERARYRGFLRNVAVAMGNAGDPGLREPLERLAAHDDPLVAEHARRALARLR